ncbi:MAG: CgeB family protein [Planctomycetota bacterium]
MSKLLYVGDLTPGTRSEQRLRALEGLGHQVTAVPVVPRRPDAQTYPKPRLFDRVARKLGRPVDRAGANDRILRRIESEDFDALWIEGGRAIRLDTLLRARGIQPDLAQVSFSEDDLWMRHNLSRTWREALPAYDLVVTTKHRNADPNELPSLGARAVHYEPKTFDPSFHFPREIDSSDRRRLGGDLGFIGTYERQRADACLELARSGFEVRVFGNGWERWRDKHPRLRVEGRAVSGEDYVRAILATSIQLGFLRRQNRDLHTDRSVEIPACGGFMLAERSVEHLDLFVEDREAAYFGSTEELIEKADHFLTAHEERRAIAEAGRQRCLESNYSHHGACARILARVGVPSPTAPDKAAHLAWTQASPDTTTSVGSERHRLRPRTLPRVRPGA